jgi:hypothetical protein
MKRLPILLVLLALAAPSSAAPPVAAPAGRTPAAETIWVRVATGGPSPRWGAAMAYDPLRDRVVLYGGGFGRYPTLGYLDDTFEFDGTTWTQRNTPVYPGELFYGRAVWSPDRSATLLWGGESFVTPPGRPLPPGSACGLTAGGDYYLQLKLWLWNGVAWSQQPLDPAWPEGRCGHGLAYDQDYQAPVMYGGRNETGGYAADTWEWHSPGWLRYTANAPGPREGVQLAYHAGITRTLLFGGVTDGTYHNDTWTWGGARTDWQSVPDANPPSARSDMGLTYDSTRGRVVLFGGTGPAGALGDTWEWNGSWARSAIAGSPGARQGASLVYDSARGRLVLFGGAAGTSDFGDTWVTAVYTPTNWTYLPLALR